MARVASRCLIGLLAISLAATTAAIAEDGSTRFQLRGEIRIQARSDEGRFALGADLKVIPERVSADGRFVIKAVNVPEAGCDPLLDLFANGFEGP